MNTVDRQPPPEDKVLTPAVIESAPDSIPATTDVIPADHEIWELVASLQVEVETLRADNERLTAESNPAIVKARLLKPYANRVFRFLVFYTSVVFAIHSPWAEVLRVFVAGWRAHGFGRNEFHRRGRIDWHDRHRPIQELDGVPHQQEQRKTAFGGLCKPDRWWLTPFDSRAVSPANRGREHRKRSLTRQFPLWGRGRWPQALPSFVQLCPANHSRQQR